MHCGRIKIKTFGDGPVTSRLSMLFYSFISQVLRQFFVASILCVSGTRQGFELELFSIYLAASVICGLPVPVSRIQGIPILCPIFTVLYKIMSSEGLFFFVCFFIARQTDKMSIPKHFLQILGETEHFLAELQRCQYVCLDCVSQRSNVTLLMVFLC